MVRFSLNVNRDRISACFDKARRIMIGGLDHQVNIERQICFFAHNADNLWPKGNVIDEMSIHNVAVNPVGTSLLDALDFVSQSGEIGGED